MIIIRKSKYRLYEKWKHNVHIQTHENISKVQNKDKKPKCWGGP